MDIVSAHRQVYDALADEYEERAETLRPVTEEALTDLTRLLPADALVLDVGCGVGLVAETLAARGFRTVACDLSPRMAELARRRSPSTEVICGDYSRLSFQERFDAIVGFAFIHLFPTEQAASVLAKLHDDLRPGGLLYIGTTEAAESREGFEAKADYDPAPPRFRKRWTRAEFETALTAAGFEPVLAKTHGDPYGKRWMDMVVRRPDKA